MADWLRRPAEAFREQTVRRDAKLSDRDSLPAYGGVALHWLPSLA